jgi:hypothetical protein
VTATAATAGNADVGSRPVPDAAGAPGPCAGAVSAREAFDRTWLAVRRYFGAAGEPAPRLRFSGRPIREMRVEGTAAGDRQLVIFATERRALGGERGCRDALSARECLIHEFVHVYQAEPYASGEIRPDQVFEEVPEGLAEARAQSLMWTVFHQRRNQYDEAIWSVYDVYARQIRKRYQPTIINRGQFGDNWGHNPRRIPWREPNPVR